MHGTDGPLQPGEDLARIDAAIAAAECVAQAVAVMLPGSARPWVVVVPDAEAVRALGIVNLHNALRFRCENAAVKLPAALRPEGVTIARAPLPRTAAGDVDRDALARDLAREQSLAWPASPSTATPLPESWVRWLQSQPELRAHRGAWLRETSLEFDCGLDSLDRLSLLAGLAQATQREVPEHDHAHWFTLGDVIDAFGPDAPRVAPAAETTRATRREAIVGAPSDPPPSPRYAGTPRLSWLITRLFIRPYSTRRLKRENAPRVIGFDRVDWNRRPLIVAQNHQSTVDPELTAVVMPPALHRQTVFIGYSGYFGRGLGKLVGSLFRIAPIDADAWATTGLRLATSAVRRGRVLLIYPEGERTWDGRLIPFRRGVAWIAAETGAWVVPSAIAGSYQAAPRGWPRAPHPVTIAFGAPLPPPPREGGREAEDVFLDALRGAITGLMREAGADAERGDPETWALGPPALRGSSPP